MKGLRYGLCGTVALGGLGFGFLYFSWFGAFLAMALILGLCCLLEAVRGV